MTPAFVGFAGTALSVDERALFRDTNPAGYILFARNIDNPDQVRELTASLRGLHGRDDLPILIDQEGGPVARLKPPIWPEFPAATLFDSVYDIAPASALAAAEANALAIALMLGELGISVNCMPLLDVRRAGTHRVIANRSLGADPTRVAALGRAVLTGLAAGGVVGVVKHMPGQGRALVDSHAVLPVIDDDADALESDIAPFRALCHAPMGQKPLMGMTAHVIYRQWDGANAATHSALVIEQIIRTAIGFDGLLMTDGLEMEALSGSIADRADRALIAGCDIALHCSGDFADMAAMMERIGGKMTSRSHDRLYRAMHGVNPTPDFAQAQDACARRDALCAIISG